MQSGLQTDIFRDSPERARTWPGHEVHFSLVGSLHRQKNGLAFRSGNGLYYDLIAPPAIRTSLVLPDARQHRAYGSKLILQAAPASSSTASKPMATRTCPKIRSCSNVCWSLPQCGHSTNGQRLRQQARHRPMPRFLRVRHRRHFGLRVCPAACSGEFRPCEG